MKPALRAATRRRTAPLAGSTTSPAALTATSAPTVTPPAQPHARRAEPALGGAARTPAPCRRSRRCRRRRSLAAPAPARRLARPRRRPRPDARPAAPTGRSKSTAAGTMGTRSGPTSTPRRCASSQRITPLAASRPNALPPPMQHRMDALDRVHRVEQIGLARPRRRAADVHAGHGAVAVASTTVHPVARLGPSSGPRPGRRRRSGSRSCVLLGGVSGSRIPAPGSARPSRRIPAARRRACRRAARAAGRSRP